MSEDLLRIIPSDPSYVPTPQAAEAATALLRSFLPQAARVSFREVGGIQFFDCGPSNLERVLCPSCGVDVLASGVWQDLVDGAYESAFQNLIVVPPCCGRAASLNDLAYTLPCGFASCVLEVRDYGRMLVDRQVRILEAALGSAVRQIRTHV